MLFVIFVGCGDPCFVAPCRRALNPDLLLIILLLLPSIDRQDVKSSIGRLSVWGGRGLVAEHCKSCVPCALFRP